MISLGPMSVTLLIAALQALVLAGLLLRAPHGRDANRWLALLLLAVVALMTPYIIGYAGFYDRWPWLSFAPFSYTLAFGPLLWLYACERTGAPPRRVWGHFIPVTLQFCADALVFPWPLPIKDAWDASMNAPYIAPLFEWATFLSLAIYAGPALTRHRAYVHWLGETRADGVDFDPGWIRNAVLALGVMGVVWLGFAAANRIDPERDYFDQFWLYVGFGVLSLYLGVAGWRDAAARYPLPKDDPLCEAPPAVEGVARDWGETGRAWLSRIEAEGWWRDPDLTLASLARRLGTNTSYLSRAFNEGLGANFNSVINRIRIEAVKSALQSGQTGGGLLDLAFDAGFRSKASFNRAFHEVTGMSPTRWRLKS
jgi:AraC-like DNA-binding protein